MIEFINASKIAAISFNLLYSICFVETGLRNVDNFHDNKHPSRGICQVQVNTARFFAPHLDALSLKLPVVNTLIAAKYLAYQNKRYKGNLVKVISSYNAGHFITGNKKYVAKVKKVMRELERKQLALNDQT